MKHQKLNRNKAEEDVVLSTASGSGPAVFSFDWKTVHKIHRCQRDDDSSRVKTDVKQDIDIKINGKQQLRVQKVALVGRNRQQSDIFILNEQRSRTQEQATINATLSMEPEDFMTARTSREEHSRNHLSMKDLIRVVRIEEGLEVTPRVDEQTSSSSQSIMLEMEQPLSANGLISQVQKDHTRGARKAVFDINGDITDRTASTARDATSRLTPSINYNGTSSLKRHSSIVTISGDDLEIPEAAHSSALIRYISALPQVITALIGLSFAWIVKIIDIIGNLGLNT
uniref:FHA domain-containing protein n=1 Tax=Heterorhabditis bacteriophora TaxID=37862 RepID=A0A1I7XNQ8_HETBA